MVKWWVVVRMHSDKNNNEKSLVPNQIYLKEGQAIAFNKRWL